MKVFVADGGERTSLAIARSLGRKGIEIHCGERYRLSATSLSRYCTKSFVYPDPQADCQGFMRWLVELLKNGGYDAVYSSREVTTIPISYYKKTLEKYVKVPYPDYGRLVMTHDKARTLRRALECGVSVPRTHFLENMDDLKKIPDDIEYPLVVKPRYKTFWVRGKPRMLKVTSRNYVRDAGELARMSQEIYGQCGRMPLVQEYIRGTGYGVEVLFNHGEPRAVFMHKRLREYPITGGASTLRESIYDELFIGPALRLMKSLAWHGVAMVEFKLDEKDGAPKLMEINGRFWGSLPLSIVAGVDFPYLLHKITMEGDVEPVLDYTKGVRCRWLLPGDILWLASSLKSGQGKLSMFGSFITGGGTYDDIISREDPLPARKSVV